MKKIFNYEKNLFVMLTLYLVMILGHSNNLYQYQNAYFFLYNIELHYILFLYYIIYFLHYIFFLY